MFERPRLRNNVERLWAAALLLWALGAALAGQWLMAAGCAAGLAVLMVVAPRDARREHRYGTPRGHRATWIALLLAGVVFAGVFRQWGPVGAGMIIGGLLMAQPRRAGRWTLPNSTANWTGYGLVAGGLGFWVLNAVLIQT